MYLFVYNVGTVVLRSRAVPRVSRTPTYDELTRRFNERHAPDSDSSVTERRASRRLRADRAAAPHKAHARRLYSHAQWPILRSHFVSSLLFSKFISKLNIFKAISLQFLSLPQVRILKLHTTYAVTIKCVVWGTRSKAADWLGMSVCH